MKSVVLLACVCATALASEKYSVKILDIQYGTTDHPFVVQGTSRTLGTSSTTCVSNSAVTNCSGVGDAMTVDTPATVGRYKLLGAVLTLQVPDGRIVIAACSDKPNLTGWTTPRRSCRIPEGNAAWGDFDGEKVKLIWPVGLDGKKSQQETYKIFRILPKPTTSPSAAPAP